MEDVTKYIQELQEKSKEFFEKAGKKILEVYHIQKMDPKPVPEDLYGQFYIGDSYVALK
jgi:hypothetical protein